jgi:hypothetical protein
MDEANEAPETTEDLTKVSDPEFLAERRRVREELEHVPEQSIAADVLTERYRVLNDEFLRRASRAWAPSKAS